MCVCAGSIGEGAILERKTRLAVNGFSGDFSSEAFCSQILEKLCVGEAMNI